MNCEVKELSMPDGNVNFVYHWIPVETESVVVLSHGMAEHAARYARFAEFLAKNKIALIAEDHRGHGKTGLKAQTDGTGMPGFLADKDGFNLVTEDIHEEILYAKKIFPGKKIFLLGHSFGSFISRHFPAFLSYLFIILIGLSTNPLSMMSCMLCDSESHPPPKLRSSTSMSFAADMWRIFSYVRSVTRMMGRFFIAQIGRAHV